MTSNRITRVDLDKADVELKFFLEIFQKIYGNRFFLLSFSLSLSLLYSTLSPLPFSLLSHSLTLSQAKDQLEWATALALAALAEWFKVVEDEWELIAERGFAFLDSHNARSLISLATTLIQSLARP